MHGSPARFSRELAEALAEIDRYGHALSPASGTLVLRRNAGRIPDAVMPRARVAPASAAPGRPWTLSAAMEPVPDGTRHRPDRLIRDGAADARALLAAAGRRSRRVRAVTALLCLLLAGTAALLLLRFFQRPAVSQPGQGPPSVALTALRTVAASIPSQAVTAPTARIFARGTPSVFVDVHYRGRAVDPLTLLVVSRTISTAATTTVLRRSYVLASGGEAVIALDAPAGGFAAGVYTVMAQLQGALLGDTSFTVP
ncbi:MAG: hypothetical protein E6J45_07820 [Chloroflexi bacterium]|nr:MAG: hypothetical protein E6J45_07820 [Chloroflexota bacterium]